MIIGGILMILSSTVGSIGVYEFLEDYLVNQFPSLTQLLNVVMTVIRFIADWGGGAIIFGAFLIMFNQFRLGKWIISVGLAFGTIALIIWVISKIADITGIITDPQIVLYLDNLKDFFTYGTTLQFIGVTVVIIGRIFIKKKKKIKEGIAKEEEFEAGEEPKATDQPSAGSKLCPNCGSTVDWTANFCNECGTTFDS
jgi:hypothetical protein